MRSPNTYRHVICACCFLLLFTNLGLPSSSFSVYQPHIAQMVGDANASFVVASRTGTSLVCMLLVGLWYKRLDCRLGMFVATLLTAAGFLLYSQAQGLVMLCVASSITGAGYGLGGMVGMTLLISRWYTDHVGTAVGFATMGSGFATMVVPLMATAIINAWGLQAAFAFESGLAVLVGLLLLALLRNQPDGASHGVLHRLRRRSAGGASQGRPCGVGAGVGSRVVGPGGRAAGAQAAEGKSQAVGMSEGLAAGAETPVQGPLLSAGLRRVMFVATFLVGSLSVVGQGYLSILMTSTGYDPVFAATMLSVNGGCLMVAKGVNGYVFDKLGRRRGSAIFFALLIVGMLLLCLVGSGSKALAVAGSGLMGAGIALATTGISVWSIDLSFPAERPAFVKNMQICYAMGSFLFNLAPGMLAELTGTYVTTYVICLAMAVVCAAFVIGVYRRLGR